MKLSSYNVKIESKRLHLVLSRATLLPLHGFSLRCVTCSWAVCHPQVFSCRLGSEQETALSIIDPVNIQVELCGSPTYQSSSGLLDAFNVEDIPPLLEVKAGSRGVSSHLFLENG